METEDKVLGCLTALFIGALVILIVCMVIHSGDTQKDCERRGGWWTGEVCLPPNYRENP